MIVAALVALALTKRPDIRAAILCYIGAAAIMTAAGICRLRHLIFHRWTLDWSFARKSRHSPFRSGRFRRSDISREVTSTPHS